MSLDRSTTVQSQRSITYDMSIIDESITAPPVEELLEKGVDPDDEYEGIRNRGWVYISEAFPGSNALQISFIGSMQSGLINLLGLFLPLVIQLAGYRGTMLIGTILAPLGLIAASFTTELWQLYLTQGLMFGIGGALGYQPAMMIPAQYLRRNRSLAAGICICGSGVGGLALNPVSPYKMKVSFISNYGFRASLRYHGIIGLGVMLIGNLLTKPKYSMPKTKLRNFKFFDTSLLTLPMSLLLLFSFLVPFGYLVPFYMIPMYAVSIGLTAEQGALILAIGSGVNAISRVVFGTMADKWLGRINVMFALTLLSGLSTMLIWPFAKSYACLLVYFLIYSASAGVFQSVLPAITTDLCGVDHIAHGMTMYFLAAGPGFLLGTPIAGLIFDSSNYLTVIEISASLTVLASLAALALRVVIGGWKPFTKV
ncbi:hypothetical protein INT43_005220 [Umbelopsis isabellina]|uniref:Major facilitator superfamily (MFS) profile domain-containing protein n=1 Tax=Mortierella isabellina TaxID=91625 RepID=A0A8H7PHI7_MORIS|nr:hypothetical protein INT43_005220 [Umbelopsis isabellina]